MLSIQTVTARSTSLTRQTLPPLSTVDAARIVLTYQLLHYSEDQLDQMASTEEAREAAAKAIIPNPELNLSPEQSVLIEQMKRFSPHLGCWRSLIRELLAERRRQTVALA